MRDNKLNELVRKEAKNLIKNATDSERAELTIENLYSQSATRCIYGQMTGSCYSRRAVELIEDSCEKVYRRTTSDGITGELNGKPSETSRNWYWSPIEIFIDLPLNKVNGNNRRLVAYLKGETKRLIIK